MKLGQSAAYALVRNDGAIIKRLRLQHDNGSFLRTVEEGINYDLPPFTGALAVNVKERAMTSFIICGVALDSWQLALP